MSGPERTREQLARDNYCRIMGHHLTVRQEGDQAVLRCDNRCWIDGNYLVVKREAAS